MSSDECKTLIGEVIADVTGENVGPLADDVQLREQLKLDSLDLVSMVIEVQARLGIAIEAEELASVVTVGDLVHALQAKFVSRPARAA